MGNGNSYLFESNGIFYNLTNNLQVNNERELEWVLLERINESDPWVQTSQLELQYFAIALKDAILES